MALGIEDPQSWSHIYRSTPGAVVGIGVNSADPNDKTGDRIAQLIKDGLRTVDGEYCGGKCFAVLVEIDKNTGRVVRIRGLGMSDEEARRLAQRMGFEEGRLAPWAQSREPQDIMNMDKRSITQLSPTDPRSCSACNQ